MTITLKAFYSWLGFTKCDNDNLRMRSRIRRYYLTK